MVKEKRLTKPIQCGHCGNKAQMEVISEYYLKTLPEYKDGKVGFDWGEGKVYELLLCLVCSNVTLRSYYHIDYVDEVTHEYHYPSGEKKLLGLPPAIQRAYDAAIKVKYIDVNAYAVLIGRVLDMVCEDRSADGKTLNEKLADLSKKGEIPDKLVKVAHSLRNLRNIGAHAELGELTKSEEPILTSLCSAILEYVYSAPYLAQQAEDRLKRFKETSK